MTRRLPSHSRSVPGYPEHDTTMMRRAIDLAAQHHPHPNPRVGAVIVGESGDVVGEGAHQASGAAHAEVVALTAAGETARGATLYVSLEPCAHHGRTPPCTDAIIAAGITRVVVAVADPDPLAAGGIDLLRQAGIEVDSGVLADEALVLDRGYFHHRRTGMPLVTLKLATTLDGQIAAADGTSQWITGEEARRDVHLLRAESDAVMVGAGTLRHDDPRLDVRLDERGSIRQPRPVVVAGSAPLPETARLYRRNPLIYRTTTGNHQPPGTEVVVVPGEADVDLTAMLKDLGERGVVDLLVEGGPTLAACFLASGRIDRLVWYLGARLAGGVGRPVFPGGFATLGDAHSLRIVSVDHIGEDIRVVAHLGADPSPRSGPGEGA